MHELNPDQRRTLLKRYIDRSKSTGRILAWRNC